MNGALNEAIEIIKTNKAAPPRAGVIIGKALYEQRFTLSQAILAADRGKKTHAT